MDVVPHLCPLHELSFGFGVFCGGQQPGWCSRIIPTPGSGSSIKGYVRADNQDAIVYIGPERRTIHEVLFTAANADAGKTWADHVILNGGNFTILDLFAQRAPGNRSAVLFTDNDTNGNINGFEFSLPVGGSWQIEQF